MRKILIAVPCMDMVSARFAQSLTTLRKVDKCVVSFLIGSLVYDSRNKLAEYAVQMNADYILWLDSDVVFDPDILERMLETIEANDDIDILSGLYFRRGYPFTPVLFERLELNGDMCEFDNYAGIPAGMTEVAGCGFGCVLMGTDVLLGIAGKTKLGNWFTPMTACGEDVAFCLRARDAGYRIFCDPSIEVGHMGYAPVTKEFYKTFEDNKNANND